MEGGALSIVMCCYNSSGRLPATLSALAKITTSNAWELVLVDNGSTDGTADLARELWLKHRSDIPLHIVYEAKRGIHFARLTGLRNAANDIIVFCDDDNRLSPDYLDVAARVMADITIGVCGAQGFGIFETTEPRWFKRNEGAFGCGEQANGLPILDWTAIGMYSAGMVIRRSAILEIFNSGYNFQFASRVGDRLSGGEDFEMVVILRTAGYTAAFCRDLKFQHFMPSGRLTRAYLRKLVRGAAENAAIAYIYADTLRYLYTKEKRYIVSWQKDLLKAMYGFLFSDLPKLVDLDLAWIRLLGNIRSVLKHREKYDFYKNQLETVYYTFHSRD